MVVIIMPGCRQMRLFIYTDGSPAALGVILHAL